MAEETTPGRPKRTVAQQLRVLLATEGYRPRRPSDEEDASSIHFKVEGSKYVIRTYDQDQDFVGIYTGYTLDDTSKDELTLVRAALGVQNEMKVVKVYLPPGLEWVEFQVELFLGGTPMSADLLERCIKTLQATRKRFYERVTPGESPRAQA